MSVAPKELPQKLTYDQIPYTRWERIRLWLREIGLAIQQTPETHWSRARIINPGEPGYDSPFNFILVKRRAEYPHWPGSTLTDAFSAPIEPGDMEKLAQSEEDVLQGKKT